MPVPAPASPNPNRVAMMTAVTGSQCLLGEAGGSGPPVREHFFFWVVQYFGEYPNHYATLTTGTKNILA